MVGVEYITRDNGVEVMYDGESIGTFADSTEAGRAVHKVRTFSTVSSRVLADRLGRRF